MLPLVLAACLAATVWTLGHGLMYREPLVVLLGVRGWLLFGALGSGTVVLAIALLRVMRGRPALAPFAALRLLSCLLVAGAIVQLAWLQPFRRLYVDFVLGLCCSVFGACVLARPWRMLPARHVRIAALLLFNLCLLLVAAEVGLRIFARVLPSPLLARADAGVVARVRANRFAPGELRWGFPCNRGGHYDSEFLPRSQRDRPTVVMIGDSFSAGVVPHHHHFTTVCERSLGNTELYNMGVVGIGPHEYAHLLRTEALPLAPDLIVIALFIGNDIAQSLLPPRRHRALRSWLDRDQVLLALLPGRLLRLARESARRDEGAVGSLQGEDQEERRIDDSGELERTFPWLLDPQLETPTFSRATFLDLEVDHAQLVCGAGSEARYAALFALIDDMHATSGATPFAVVLIPDEFQVEDALWRDITERSGPLDRDLPQRNIAAGLDRRRIPHLDLLPALRALPLDADGRRHAYHRNDTHLNSRGNRAVGEALAPFLAPLLR